MDHETYIRAVEAGDFPEDPRVPLPKAFEDARGVIRNLLLGTVRNVALVTSKKGTIRSNHYHQEDWHYLYVVSGSLHYFERAIDGSSDVEPMLVSAGEMVFTAPMRVHRTDFLEDTVMISMGKNPQDHTRHEEDVVRVPF